MNTWKTDQIYEIGDTIHLITGCGEKHYVAVIKHKSSPVPSGFKSDLEKYWKETNGSTQSNEEAYGEPTVPNGNTKPCIDQETMAENTLILTAGIFIGLIVSKIVS